jgi:hypothetical protein
MYTIIFLGLLGCSSELHNIPYTTARIGNYEAQGEADLELKIYSSEKQCNRLLNDLESTEETLEDCMPYIDRGRGEVHLGFSFQLDGDIYPLPLMKEHMDISHQNDLVGVSNDDFKEEVQIIPHVPEQVPQIFVLMIDSSGSMNTKDKFSDQSRMDKVKEALLLPNVQKAFFPMGGKNLVSIFEFTDQGAQPLGGKTILLDNIKDYRKRIKKHLKASSGYTHLYDAIEFAIEKFLKKEQIQDNLIRLNAVPTIVLLTDGFNNERKDDACEDNAPRLQKLLKKIYRSRVDKDVDIRTRPTIYTVGLGKAFYPKFRLPRSNRTKVNSRTLCGKYMERRIDGGLETKGIDNSSLTWIAEVGGGSSFLKQNAKGLGEAFEEAASVRYNWFELRYRVNPLFLRRDFQSRLILKTFAIADSKISIYPHSLLDSPPGIVGEDGWARPPKYGLIFASLISSMGLLIFLSILGAFLFNAKRYVFGRLKPPKEKAQM